MAKTKLAKFFMMAAGAALALGAGSPAFAGIATFDDGGLGCPLNTGVGSCTDAGLTFTNFGYYMAVWDGTSPNSNGTNNLILSGFSTGDYAEITQTGGGNFTLNSIDLAISWYDSNPTELIFVNGSPLTITQTLTTYNLNLANVAAVDISGVASNLGYWTADNVNYSGATPEPAYISLIGAGIVGMGLLRRRK